MIHQPRIAVRSVNLVGLIILVVVSLGACATNRYIGSVGRDGTYANRGYGFALRLSDSDLLTRWQVLNPTELPLSGSDGLPVPRRDRIDLNGDGLLTLGEETVRFDPVLRLKARTSTDGATADLRVEIMSGHARSVGLDRLLTRALKLWTRASAVTRHRAYLGAESAELRGGHPMRVATATTARWQHHLAVIDQGVITAEANAKRRQVVTVHMYAPGPPRPQIQKDFGTLLRALLLNSAAAPESVKERW